MREVYYHDWLSNPVMVKKHDDSWRMCVDFTDLNKIQLADSDEEKAAFHTGQGVYCYTKMPFGLKNASATYQRLVDKAFDSQTGQNIEVYIEDLIIKSHTKAEMLRDIGETFPSNNKDEYEALIAGLRIAAQMGVQNIHVSTDSKLVANQVLGAYVAKEENMIKYLEKVKSLEGGKKAPYQGSTVRNIIGVLYRRLFLTPWLRCVGPLQADYVIREIHEGSCSMHVGPRKSKPKLRERNQDPSGRGKQELGEELPHVLWAHRTMIKSSHGETPFSLTYGTEAVILAEIGMPTYRTAAVDVIHNDEKLRLNLDLLEEGRERAAIHEAKAKLKMTKYYNARVRSVTFRPGDFVYRSNDASHAMDGRNSVRSGKDLTG
nr:hypothetical protein [Tanacetum cinerariifolium]